eukprot:6509-Heterococcus_DN1.PRE.1
MLLSHRCTVQPRTQPRISPLSAKTLQVVLLQLQTLNAHLVDELYCNQVAATYDRLAQCCSKDF